MATTTETVMETSEVNPVDYFVEGKIAFPLLFYKLMCGAIVTVIALRLSDALKNITETMTSQITHNTIVKALLDVLVTILMVLLFARIVRSRVSNNKFANSF
jgi:dTDP-4-dehydrorhamnose reductase